MAEYTHGPVTSVTIPQEKTQRADHQTDDIHAHMSSCAVCLGTSEMFSECLMVSLSFRSLELPVLNHWGEPVETSKILSIGELSDGFIHPPGCSTPRIPCNSLWSHDRSKLVRERQQGMGQGRR